MDVIQLLSDHIANQIAAGEVVQRPASAVKELLENAIDAGATEIQLVIKDAGKELIQVIDNGKGMSPTDARMSFERHATSKIKHIDDLFKIRTMGFRGEALASVAAVAQVEMKTAQEGSELGSRIIIEGTEVKSQEPCVTAKGTNIAVKNLFFNVPARRHFLKSNNTEYRHILDEFTRVALAHPQISFRLWNNGTEQVHLESGNLKTRIVGLLGNTYEKNLVPVEEVTDVVTISGFIGKPEAATRTRGMQFFFINNRFIRNPYLHHALVAAYEGMIEKESFPFYVLFLETDPSKVDVNVHPTKQEVKFDDDRMMYAYLNAAVKHALARYNIAPSLDFTLNASVTHLPSVQRPVSDEIKEQVEKGYLFQNFTQKNQAHFIDKKDGLKNWQSLYAIAQQALPDKENTPFSIPSAATIFSEQEETVPPRQGVLLVQGSMLVTTVKSGLMLIHVRRAQERIWYERLVQSWNEGDAPAQQLLFPVTYEFSPQDALLLQSVLADLAAVGFDIVASDKNTFILQGVPANLPTGEEKKILDEVIEQLRFESSDAVTNSTDRMLVQLAKQLARNIDALQHTDAQNALIDELFACQKPEFAPDGKKIFNILKKETLDSFLH